MITFTEAQNILSKIEPNFKVEKIKITESLGRILSEPIYSDINMPPFNKSAVDGYACKKTDINSELEVIEIIAAGDIPQKTVNTNQCSKIMTGAVVPAGADTVIMIEDVDILTNGKIKNVNEKVKQNICYTGEDFKIGEKLLEKGLFIEPQHIAIMASVGKTEIDVFTKPKISIITTGNEIVEPDNKPLEYQIRNSNGMQLFAQVQKLGAIPNYLGIIKDNIDDLSEAIKNAALQSNIILLTGGVSVGDYDFVPKVLKSLGFEILFHNISIQPGKPCLLAKLNNTYCFGFPGNPVSTYFQFELFIRPLIYKLCGLVLAEKIMKCVAAQNYTRKKAGKKAFIPVYINENNYIDFVEYHGSAHLNSLTNVIGIVSLEIGVLEIKKGEIIDVRLF